MTGIDAAASRVFETPEKLAEHVADWIVERARAQLRRFSICLCGGTTPKRLYELVGSAPRRVRLPWDRVHWFWGDERAVPPDDPQSNFGTALETMLQAAPAANIHAIPTEGVSPQVGAERYEAMLQSHYGADSLERDRPLFDLTLLGLGEDGHIASLFPGSPALAERKHWTAAVIGEKPLDRITLTYPALESSRFTAFLVTGERKRAVLDRVRAGDAALPAVRFCSAGAVYWFTDRAASPTPAPAEGDRH